MKDADVEAVANAIRKERYFWNEWDDSIRASTAIARAAIAADPVRKAMEEALEKAATQFRFYESEHRTKAELLHGNWDARSTEQDNAFHASTTKAETNKEFADICVVALARARGEQPKPEDTP